MSVIIEQPLITLDSYNDHGEEVKIDLFADDLRAAEIGHKWEAYVCNTRSAESLEVVYKNSSGIAALYRNFGSAGWDEWEHEPELIWFELHFIDEAIQKPPRRRRQEQEDETTTANNENETNKENENE